MMARRDLSTRDVSDYAAGELEYVLKKENEAEPIPTVSVEEAMAGKPVFRANTSRDVTRVLFISTGTGLLNPVSQTLDGYVEIADLFEEVHIMVLRIGIPSKKPVLRASQNVWIYTVSAMHWWELPGEGMKMIDEQLAFATGFRPDLIVARDPIESAWLAAKVSKKYNRPAQLHIVQDYTTIEFKEKQPANFFRRFVPLFTVNKFNSVRTLTDRMAQKIAEQFDPEDLKVLPRLQNYEELMNKTVSGRLSDKYQGLSVFLLYVGNLNKDSGAFKVLEAVRFILRNKRIGLIIIGEGEAKYELQHMARNYGVERQIIFEKENINLLPYLKGAHIMINPDDSEKSEEIVLQAAAAGIPLLISATEKRSDVFDDKYSAYFIDPNEVETITTGISDLLNDVEGRSIMAKNAQVAVTEKFHFDPTEYKTAYRYSIEEVLFAEMDTDDAEG